MNGEWFWYALFHSAFIQMKNLNEKFRGIALQRICLEAGIHSRKM